MADIELALDGAEAHIVLTALGMYEERLAHTAALGGYAAETSAVLQPIARRVSSRLTDQMFPEDEPDWRRKRSRSAMASTGSLSSRVMKWGGRARWNC